jgi:hypothetical protein
VLGQTGAVLESALWSSGGQHWEKHWVHCSGRSWAGSRQDQHWDRCSGTLGQNWASAGRRTGSYAWAGAGELGPSTRRQARSSWRQARATLGEGAGTFAGEKRWGQLGDTWAHHSRGSGELLGLELGQRWGSTEQNSACTLTRGRAGHFTGTLTFVSARAQTGAQESCSESSDADRDSVTCTGRRARTPLGWSWEHPLGENAGYRRWAGTLGELGPALGEELGPALGDRLEPLEPSLGGGTRRSTWASLGDELGQHSRGNWVQHSVPALERLAGSGAGGGARSELGAVLGPALGPAVLAGEALGPPAGARLTGRRFGPTLGPPLVKRDTG